MYVAEKRMGKTLYKLSIMLEEYTENPRSWYNLGTMVYGHKRYELGDEKAKNTELYKSWEEWAANNIPKDAIVLPLYLFDHGELTIRTYPFNCRWDSGQVGYIYCTKDRFRKETGYTEGELFSLNTTRTPKLGEHVKVVGEQDWGKVIGISITHVTVDYDCNKIPEARKKENVIAIPRKIIEVMSNKAEQMLENEVKIFDQYIRGDVWWFELQMVEKCSHCGEEKETLLDSCGGFFGHDFKSNGVLDHLPEEFHHLLDELVYS